ncbi:hypothetical protein VTI28DRAFT_10393 [Corynascus sepedonium]
MSSIKALLKGINEAIKQQKWNEAVEAAEDVLQKDAKNYQAHIFLAFALDKTNQLDASENTYLAATRLKPSDPQAWQGLIKLYQKQRGKKIKQYQHAALKLAEIFRDANEMYKCQDVVDKFVDHARTQGDRAQYVDALDLILPESPIYPALEGRVPHPAKTYEIQAQIVEVDEKKRINTLIGERRTRIGARVSEVTIEVKREVYSQSRLGYVYGQLINWATDDDVRRTYEEKLLQYCYDRLVAWPPGEQKEREAAMVLKLANDMVIIRHPFKFAWDIAINWQDHKEIQDWDVTVLRQYCTFFPDSDLNRVIMGFLTSDISPFPKEETQQQPKPSTNVESEDESEDDEAGGAPTTYVPLTEEDRVLMIMEGVSSADSLFALRLAGEYYQHIEDHESNVELMRKALDHLKAERSKTGLLFRNTKDAYSLYLGTALIFYQSPRHHQEAKSLFDGVLAHDPSSTGAMIGVGLIYEEEEEYTEAIDFLERALQRDPENLRVRTEAAWVKALKGDFETSRNELANCLPLLMKKGQTNKELLAQTQYRVGYCIWNLDTSKAARKSRSGAYAYFLDALKNNLNYAPAYTSLGKYYADYAKDKKRARRCFQKALELSPSEVESAERLARSFADDGDWDRVELVAQRVVDSGKVKPPPGSKRKGISWPFAALGVAELNKQDYRKAIVSFQAALRISPDDYHSWVGLGESYHGSGRYIAATKAILNAQKLEEAAGDKIPGETWFSKLILADVNRELGDFDEAITLYREIIAGRPDEAGVAISLMQATVDNALDNLHKGFFGKSIDLAAETIKFAVQAPEEIKGTFNYWKALGDACSLFSSVRGRLSDFPADTVQQLLGVDESDVLAIDGVAAVSNGPNSNEGDIGDELTRVLHATILAHKRSVQVSANDMHAQAVAYYNLGWAEHRAHMCLPLRLRKKATKYLKASIACFKRAIELEAGNSEFWNALGVVTSVVNPSVSQHSFVRSLHLNESGAHTWTNLGTLALLQGDVQFANDAFTKAQSADPDYAHAWLGQGLVALLLGDQKEARSLFTHAMDISESSSTASRRHFAISMFDHIMQSPSDLPVTSLIEPILALGQLQGLDPQELAYGHLSALFQERNHEHDRAVVTLEKICAAVESDYEVTESPESLKRFAIAKADLARAYLAVGSNEEAIEAAELAIQLSNTDDSDDSSELTAEERNRVRLSAHVTMGLAKYYHQQAGGGSSIDDAVACFDLAIDESDGNPDVACVLAQVLWATGREEARERAREVLFEVIERSPHHVQSVLLLGVIALLDEDEESLEAVVAELQSLRASDEGVTPADQRQLGEVLRAIAASGKEQQGQEEAKANQARVDVMLHPHLPHGWAELRVLGGEEGKSAAEMALRVASKGVPPRGDVAAEDLAGAYAGTGRPVDAQKAIMVAPWKKTGWQALGEVVKG